MNIITLQDLLKNLIMRSRKFLV